MFLRHWTGVEPVAICRSELASAVLRRLGVHCRVGNICKSEDAKRLVGDCDAVVDFSLPSGNFNEITASYDKIYSSVFSAIPREVPFILGSSQMAIGFSRFHRTIRYRWLSRTVYGATKRWAERRAKHYSKQSGSPLFVLRLAQVHGLIQSVSESFRNLIETGVRFQTPKGPSDTVFCFTIAEAIVNITLGREKAGTYILDSNPTWTWPEVLSFLGKKSINCIELSTDRSFGTLAIERVKKLALSNLETIQAYVLRYFPELEMKLRIRKRCNILTHTVQALQNLKDHSLETVPGKLPGKHLTLLTDSRHSMLPLWSLCEQDLRILEEKYE